MLDGGGVKILYNVSRCGGADYACWAPGSQNFLQKEHKMAKIKTGQKLLLIATLVGVVLLGAIISLVVVLAASSQTVSSDIKVTFTATDVAGTIKFSQKLGSGDFSEPMVATFDGSETSTETALDPGSELVLTKANAYAVFKYEITGHSDAGFFVSLQYLDKLAADKNNKVEYLVSTSEINNFDNMGASAPVGTIVANSGHTDGTTVYLYVKVGISDIVAQMSMDGDFNLALTRGEWADPNYDVITGTHYGYVENDGNPYAAAVGYDGAATDITINSTSVYGSELPVRVIADNAFRASTAAATSTNLTKITAGENVETISGYAFANNASLTEIVLAENVSYVAPTAFYGCGGLVKVTNNSRKVEITRKGHNLDKTVEIFNTLRIKVEGKQFNDRNYYYVEMGEYPQTYAGAATAVTGLTETQDKFVCDMSTATSDSETTITENKEYNMWKDASGNKYIKHMVNIRESNTAKEYINGQIPVTGEEAYFKIEPIKWDIVGYYNNDKTVFTRVTDTATFNPEHSENLVVVSRTTLQAMPWYPNTYTEDIDYYMTETKYSSVWHWLRTFEDHVLTEFKDVNIIKMANEYNDVSETSWNNIKNNTVTVGGTVDEYAWMMDYNQANSIFYVEGSDGDAERRCAPSDFALATRADLHESGTDYNNITRNASCGIWLRSSCHNSGTNYLYAARINHDGPLNGTYAYRTYRTIRPCMMINL